MPATGASSALIVATAMMASSTADFPNSSYCYARYQPALSEVSIGLSRTLERLRQINEVSIKLLSDIPRFREAIRSIETVTDPQALWSMLRSLERGISLAENALVSRAAESQELLQRTLDERPRVSLEVASALRGCLEATASSESGANVLSQALALLSTGDAPVELMQTGLFVDMTQLLAALPFSGDRAVADQAARSATVALGIE